MSCQSTEIERKTNNTNHNWLLDSDKKEHTRQWSQLKSFSRLLWGANDDVSVNWAVKNVGVECTVIIFNIKAYFILVEYNVRNYTQGPDSLMGCLRCYDLVNFDIKILSQSGPCISYVCNVIYSILHVKINHTFESKL